MSHPYEVSAPFEVRPVKGNAIMSRKFRIYGKHNSKRRFEAMDLKNGWCVKNLIYASILTEDEKNRFMEREAPLNPDWKFEAREVQS